MGVGLLSISMILSTVARLRAQRAEEVRQAVGQRLAGFSQQSARIAMAADEETSPLQSKRSSTFDCDQSRHISINITLYVYHLLRSIIMFNG
jgi:hypothetical protein